MESTEPEQTGMESTEPTPAETEPAGAAPADAESADADAQADPLTGFVTDPAARAELARRMTELADLIEEAGEALGEILEGVQRGQRG
jgi:hypothetical protein